MKSPRNLMIVQQYCLFLFKHSDMNMHFCTLHQNCTHCYCSTFEGFCCIYWTAVPTQRFALLGVPCSALYFSALAATICAVKKVHCSLQCLPIDICTGFLDCSECALWGSLPSLQYTLGIHNSALHTHRYALLGCIIVQRYSV